MTNENSPFADLPAGLVEEVLQQTTAVGDMLLGGFQHVKKNREALRNGLLTKGHVLSEGSLGYPPLPTTCAADGSYAIERLLTADLAAAAAVCVEGLTPPSEKRHWDQPRHTTFVVPEVHHGDTATILRAVMLGNELLLATRAPHDVVMIDGTFTLPVIYFNQALANAPAAPELRSSTEFLNHCGSYLEAYLELLVGQRSDKQFIGLPKYSTRREFGREMDWPQGYDDRGMLTLLLQAGELTKPRLMEQPKQEWHINVSGKVSDKYPDAKVLVAQIVAALKVVHVFYYKPHDWLPALRIEVAQSIASNNHRLATVVQGLKQQCSTAAMLEPYPIYLADRMVKSLARAVPAFRQVTTQRISERYEGDIGEVFFAMHGYRSESGRGS